MRTHVRNTGMQYMLQLCLHVRTGIAYPYCIHVCDTSVQYRYARVNIVLMNNAVTDLYIPQILVAVSKKVVNTQRINFTMTESV